MFFFKNVRKGGHFSGTEQTINGADAHRIRVINQSGEIIFIGDELFSRDGNLVEGGF
ncbi:Uncharacterised protein [Vibrio cholerae]|nr:Uncharacterised protein [Vibrio cholerae]